MCFFVFSFSERVPAGRRRLPREALINRTYLFVRGFMNLQRQLPTHAHAEQELVRFLPNLSHHHCFVLTTRVSLVPPVHREVVQFRPSLLAAPFTSFCPLPLDFHSCRAGPGSSSQPPTCTGFTLNLTTHELQRPFFFAQSAPRLAKNKHGIFLLPQRFRRQAQRHSNQRMVLRFSFPLRAGSGSFLYRQP